MRRFAWLVLGLPLSLACAGEAAQDDVVRTMRGDTTVVRTVSGSEWAGGRTWEPVLSIGSLDGPAETSFGRVASIAVHPDGRILVVDRQVPTVRVFTPEGAYVESWGRRGGGPGELERPDAGLVAFPDGRVVVRDRGNARLQVYDGYGTGVATWPVITGQYINRRAFGLRGDTLVNPDVVNPEAPLQDWRVGLVRIAPDGEVIDTLPIPDAGLRAHRFLARSGGNMAERDLPFAPTEHWAWHPGGFVIHGAADAYSLTLYRDGAPLAIEREVDPVAVTSAEAAQEEARVINAMRWLDAGWRWDGPGIPDTKPYFSGVITGTDGRIWVRRDGPAYEMEDPDYDPEEPYDTEIRWYSEQLLDAFEEDGTFLGTVAAPRDMDWRVPPVLAGDSLWAVTRDELGVQRVRKYVLTSRPE